MRRCRGIDFIDVTDMEELNREFNYDEEDLKNIIINIETKIDGFRVWYYLYY